MCSTCSSFDFGRDYSHNKRRDFIAHSSYFLISQQNTDTAVIFILQTEEDFAVIYSRTFTAFHQQRQTIYWEQTHMRQLDDILMLPIKASTK